ncbi:efflux RND transporter periplasmic adaptor subunit [Pseudomonas reactans]|uniref:Efflux RND transporter periplasmic adaptor subunit n=1 Tax=Pseudomonas reactans TaxID=117680 RepID=A0ABX2R353_9PSED|nr:efflux RND transporter periplasmic adaptor subunit [Pseudomonas reactans]NWD82866.1 efflux RND transporter periplasmic adaptor subunit [Pseudomonas reactans]NWD98469.1 efflux RND transporter periplasmic adaptor subunit [Pseudomonas reactans]
MRASSVAATSLAATFLLISGCNKEAESKLLAASPAVDVVSVTVQQVKPWDKFNGRVGAVETVSILPHVSGYITKVAYQEGSEVKKGDLLFIVDQRPYRAALASAQARLEQSRASLAFAKQQNHRAQQLVKTNAISTEEAEQKLAAYEQGVAEVHAAEAAVTTATLDLEFTEVRSPINGRTSRAQLTVGNLAVADQSVLTSVVSQDPVYVYFDPDEQSFLSYQKRLKASQTTSVRIGLTSDENYPYEGDLTFVDNQVDSATGTIRARATLKNPDRMLTPGLYAKVELSVGGSEEMALVPERAILSDQDKKYVYTLSDDNKAEKRYVELGKLVGHKRVITAGLEKTDRVVVSGLQQIYATGTPVSPNLPGPENIGIKISSANESSK